ncbi:hypothetical protein BASA82_001237 [Batrachochytrium salamandrivorans]|uniref:Nodulin-like domain-containing protein n=1 Tax=Batrachochytrium salamandrivorans TaxID=1357716 RepID=A0ABQ8F4K9_9FUNG|nr:hypothetical protein BASA50_008240 [Batrachochytrium salamandrivorans]KAH6599891.1 hypothetical protein BASA61_002442 [Batrachochytrium salamandrivorans]KAH9259834.1 hypothetical protein BASA82_001237 [Batrachochytrium salamandrivorans]
MKLVTLVASCFVMATAGSLFTYSVYSADLRARFGFSSANINLISGIGNTAVYISFLVVGPIYDRWGATITMVLAMLTCAIGYGGVWAAFEDIIAASSVGALCVFYFLIGVGSTAAYMAVVGVNMINFPSQKSGITLGILLLFYGLSATIYSQIFAAYYSSGSKTDAAGYLLFLTLSLTVVNIVGCLTIFPASSAHHEYYPLVSTKAVTPLSATAFNSPEDNIQRTESIALISSTEPRRYNSLATNDVVTPIQEQCHLPQPSVPECDLPLETATQPEKSLSPMEILMSKYYWLYAMLSIWQQGMTYISNIDTIIIAISGPTASTESLARECALHVTLFSIFQSVGRFSTGAIADLIQTRLALDPSLVLVVSQILLFVSHAVVAFFGDELGGVGAENVESTGLLYFCSACIGLGWGSAGAMFPSTIRDLFGTAFYGTACGLVMMGVPIGILVSNLVFGVLYDAALESQPKDPNGIALLECYGSSCFSRSFMIAFAIQAIPVIVSVMMFLLRTQERRRNQLSRTHTS